ncbi:hypothetical protein [Mesorhizobium wenxiniae]|uniref:Uncharacterized protein n=1 Tax=Mesorhizobium wenxiniae TaxID=2014805 RepID=A0A271KAT1_9HYPH|nr:hypothetical protein [Mesorhizobium wenxiniae]PAP92841.1 hypothetical protein CIT31_24920 [Mesorhizobium wenxiniae]
MTAGNQLDRLREIASDVSAIGEGVEIERHAASIATVMAAVHGGEWRIQIDHLTGFVLVRRS